ncbi:hypothetical protein IKD57_02120 [Candidatus Saccharibacteria bacterium]|nr:hypothetical protein [Candidatus Saccharibacteria bacterium]
MDPSKPSNEPAPEMPTKTEAETSAPTEAPTPTEMPTETEAPKETSTETEIATSPQPIAPAKPTDKKKVIALVVVLVLIVATLATVLIVQNLNNRSTKSTNTAPQTSSDETIDDSEDNCEDSNSDDCKTSESSSEQSSSEVVTKDTKEEVKSLMETFKSAAESAAVNTFGQSIDLSIAYYDNGGVSYKFDGAKVATPTTGAYSLFTADASNSDTPIIETMGNAITAKAKELGFIEYTENTYNLAGRPSYYLPSSQIICAGIDVGTIYYINISCASTSWHTQESIDLTNQLADAYYAKVGSYPHDINATYPKIENSLYRPYQRMETTTLGAILLFYRTSPDAAWQFFKGTQAISSCDEFNTPDLRRAFAGTTCVTNGYQQTTVTAD